MTVSFAIIIISLVVHLPSISPGVEIVSRISDKEVIESLATLKEGHKALNMRINHAENSLDTTYTS